MARADDYQRAIKAALDAASVPCGIGQEPVGRGWPGPVTDPGTFQPYVVLWMDAGLAGPLSVAQRNEWVDFLFQISAIGETNEQANQYASRAAEVLLALALSISGQAVHRIVQLSTQMPRRDAETSPGLWLTTTQYRMSSTPA